MDSQYCPLPTSIDGWLGAMTTRDKWTSSYPLIVVLGFNDTCVDFVCLEDFHLCSFGFSFLIEAVSAALLFLVSTVCILRLQVAFPTSHHARKILFVLLALVGGIRAIYNALASNKVMGLEMYLDTLNMIPWFLKTNIPVNAVSDLLVAFVDFLLSFFWLDVMYHRVVRSRVGLMLQGMLFLVSSLALAFTLYLDYDDVVVKKVYNNGNAYYRSLSYLVGLLFVSGLLHIVVVVLLLFSMFRVTRDLTIFLDPKMRHHVVLVAVIGFVSAVCLLVRATILLGRVALVQEYVSGALSFDNPTFTTVYYVLMMNLPCIVVAVAFAVMTNKLIQDENRELEDNHGTRDSLLLQSGHGIQLASPSSPLDRLTSGPRSPMGPPQARVGPRSPTVVVVNNSANRRSAKRMSSGLASSRSGSLDAMPVVPDDGTSGRPNETRIAS